MANEINGLPSSFLSRIGESFARAPANGQKDPAQTPPAAAAGQSRSMAAMDSVSLTGEADWLKALEEQLAAQPAEDPRRVEAIRQALAEGSYRIDPERIAERLLAFENLLGRAGSE